VSCTKVFSTFDEGEALGLNGLKLRVDTLLMQAASDMVNLNAGGLVDLIKKAVIAGDRGSKQFLQNNEIKHHCYSLCFSGT
jgi:hypothetical protein